MSPLAMTVAEREAFLSDLHVGVLGIERKDGPPLVIPVWYVYEPGGEVWFLTEPDTLKGRLISSAHRFSMCVQSETPPYAYVSVEGPATARDADAGDERRMAQRYLGPELGDQYAAKGKDRVPLRIGMRPERWWSADYDKSSE